MALSACLHSIVVTSSLPLLTIMYVTMAEDIKNFANNLNTLCLTATTRDQKLLGQRIATEVMIMNAVEATEDTLWEHFTKEFLTICTT